MSEDLQRAPAPPAPEHGSESTSAPRPPASRAITALIALLLAALAFTAVLSSQRSQGIARDEVVYMAHGERYARWWSDLLGGEDGMLSESSITAHFGGPGATANNREHPPLMKTLFGFSARLFHHELGWTRATTAHRLPSAFMNAVLIALVFLFAAGAWGRPVGLLAALLTLLLPRAFFHAGLACFDAAVVTTWFATLYAYHRALRSRRWVIGLGVVFGLALATKHNALMLPGVLGLHYLWLAVRSRGAASDSAAEGDPDSDADSPSFHIAVARRLVAIRPSLLISLLVIGPLVAIALWPWLWFDTGRHIADWIRFHLHHVHYNYEYLGDNWNAGPYPWHVPVVTTLVTVPVVTSLAAVIGAAYTWRQWRRGRSLRARLTGDHAVTRSRQPDDRAPIVLLVLSALVAMGPFLLGRAPIFGAEKHWAPAIPTLCILAAIGVAAAASLAARPLAEILADRMPAQRARQLVLAILGTLAVLAAAAETFAAQPYALSHYNALAGGAPGGADLGMNRHYWGYAARGVLSYLDQHAPGPGEPPVRIYSHDASPAWGLYHREGLLAPGLPDAGREAHGIGRSHLALVIHERHFNRHDYLIWTRYGTVQPVHVLTFQGVPIVSVYRRPPK